MLARRLGEAAHNTLCTAWRRVVLRVGKADALALHLGVPTSRVTEWGQPESGRSPPVAVVLEAEAFAGEPIVAEALAAAQGFRLLPVEPSGAVALGPLAGRVMREIGEAMGLFAEAVDDGEISEGERARLIVEYSDVANAALKMVAALQAGRHE